VRDVAYASPGELESMGMACLKKWGSIDDNKSEKVQENGEENQNTLGVNDSSKAKYSKE
jgi:hypothetical protein